MKKLSAFLATAVLAVSLTACSSGGSKTAATDDITIDTSSLASALLDTVTSDELSKTAEEMIPSIYFLESEDVASAAAYASSGATSCEIAVIESSDASDTGNVEKMIQQRVDNQQELYATYDQEEASRLDSAIIKSAGSYTVLCVCDDTDKAEEILKDYGF